MINLFKKFPWLRHLVFSLSTILLIFSICLLPSISTAQMEGKPLVVATEPTFPPFEFQGNDGSDLQGFDIDLMREIGKQIGRPIEFTSLPFDGIIPALQANTIDAAVSGITVTKERAQTLAFSSPYFKAGLAIAVKENNDTIKNFADLANKRIAVQIGTTGAMEAKKVPGVQVTEFDGAVLALQELVNGKVDAVVNDGPVTLYAIKNAGLKGVKVVGELLTEEFYAVALPQKSQDVSAINYGLFRILENGIYQNIYEKWFGTTPPQLPLIAPAMVASVTGNSANPGSVSAASGEAVSVYQLLLKNLPLGVAITLLLTTFSVFFGLIGGTLIAMILISPSNILRSLGRIYVEFFRGTPMLVQLFIIYFGLPALFQEFGWEWSLDRFPAAIIALSLNVAAYLAEIIRGGIQSVDQGQWEACQSLGMTSMQTMTDVIFPQAFRRILPPLGNEFITLIKDTSLTAVIGFAELFRQGQLIVATTYQAFEVYIVVALVYLVLTTLSSFFFKWLESYMDPLSRIKANTGH